MKLEATITTIAHFHLRCYQTEVVPFSCYLNVWVNISVIRMYIKINKTGQLALIRSPLENKIITRSIFRQMFVACHGSHESISCSKENAASKHDKSCVDHCGKHKHVLLTKCSFTRQTRMMTFHNFLIFGDLFITNMPNSAMTAAITYFSDFPCQESGSFWEATCCDMVE